MPATLTENDNLEQNTQPIKVLPNVIFFEEFSASQNKSTAKESNLTAASTNEPPPERMWLRNNSAAAAAATTASNATTTQQQIPKIVHKIFLQKSGELTLLSDMSPQLQDAHISWKLKNPEYKMQYYDLKTCREYLALYFHPVFLRAFDCLEAFAIKADFMRYLLVYKAGGW